MQSNSINAMSPISWGIMKYFLHWSQTMWSVVLDPAQSRIEWVLSCWRACLPETFFARALLGIFSRALLPGICCSGFVAQALLGLEF